MRTFALEVALLALAGLARADDVDPEPPRPSPLRPLQGRWQSVRRITKGKEGPLTTTSYLFEKDKVTTNLGKNTPQAMTLKADKQRRDVIEMAPDKGRTQRFFFKIEKGELYLTAARSKDPKAKADFSSQNAPVNIFKKVK